ncbi:hypothetical protein L1049_028165 [Liquidambar formosana]|uniref:Uncharacterized protein n=1 Tax=Liquidambar formosana TaxID=63359 RepID=A0AAP0RJZ1_LIQFO
MLGVGSVKGIEACAPTDSQFGNQDSSSSELCAGDGAHSLGENQKFLRDIESEDVRIIVEKLEQLLVEQQKELDELKRKHELATIRSFEGISFRNPSQNF